MHVDPKERAEELFKMNLNHLLKVPNLSSDTEAINYLDVLKIIAQIISASNIRKLLEDQMTPEQSQYYNKVLEEILKIK
jgi:hypothetical protein